MLPLLLCGKDKVKIIYEEYSLTYKNHDYHILVPKNVPLDEAWVTWLDSREEPYVVLLDGNRKFLEQLRDAAVTLSVLKDKIIYFPIRNIPALNETHFRNDHLDLVLYNHQVQLPRHHWIEMKHMMRYLKPNQTTVRCNLPRLMAEYPHVLHQWKKSKSYYKYPKNKSRNYLASDTVFLEGSWRNYLGSLLSFQDFLNRDLESEAFDNKWCPCTGAFEAMVEVGFLTRESYKSWEVKWAW